jgi:hypothetical protein
MLDCVKKSLDWCPDYVKTIHKRVQDFNFSENRFDCIIGVWSLCYLNTEEREQLINVIYGSLRP